MSLLKTRAPDGTERFWSLKEIVQGRPLGHASHPMFVHFPVAFYFGAVTLDTMSVLWRFPEAPLAATWLLIGAFAGSIFAVTTGLVDWWSMVPRSTKRRWATNHMLLQFLTLAIFLTVFVLRWEARRAPEAEVMWIALGALGLIVMTVAQWMGGILVYRLGMRVNTDASDN